MRNQVRLPMVLLTIFITVIPAVAYAAISIGVKKGDWIEYQVTVAGTVPQDHNITWARMDVTDVQGTAITLNITTIFSNETLLPEKITLNLETGVLGDDFIIPANLNYRDTFFDMNQGNITIRDTGEKTVAGVDRTVVSGTTTETTYFWDKATGFLVEATTIFSGYTMTTKVERTNMWTPLLFGLDPAFFFILIAIAIVAVLAATAILVMSRRKIAP